MADKPEVSERGDSEAPDQVRLVHEAYLMQAPDAALSARPSPPADPIGPPDQVGPYEEIGSGVEIGRGLAHPALPCPLESTLSTRKNPLEYDKNWVSGQENLLRKKLGLNEKADHEDVFDAYYELTTAPAKAVSHGVPSISQQEVPEIRKLMQAHEDRLRRKMFGLDEDASEKEILKKCDQEE